MGVSDALLCVFNARVQQRDGEYFIEVPENEITLGGLDEGGQYRVALLPPSGSAESSHPANDTSGGRSVPEPPVEEGDTLEVEIEDIGDQGDGIARIDSGYIIFVPDTTLHERVTVEVSDVLETMAFAEVIGRQDRGR